MTQKLNELAVGSRLIVRSRTDWRFASISKMDDKRVVLTVCSPSGRTYRLRRDLDAAILWESTIPVLEYSEVENWRDNFCCYDVRW